MASTDLISVIATDPSEVEQVFPEIASGRRSRCVQPADGVDGRLGSPRVEPVELAQRSDFPTWPTA
ncbi:hypothetical protein ACWED2_09600 [Amycolatopsis sp. NPDC005003]